MPRHAAQKANRQPVAPKPESAGGDGGDAARRVVAEALERLPRPTTPNLLYYGDNLDVLRRHIPDESVDLVYLDPPFNSNATYNVLFAEQDGSRAAAQIKAFGDTWRWDESSSAAFADVMDGGGKVAETLLALKQLVGFSNMLAYLSMMAPRLVELRRVMKPTASIYLHCDPTASHYLKALMDAVLGPANFRNEIIWKRTAAKALMSRRLPSNHDCILAYQKGPNGTWNEAAVFTPYVADALNAKTAEKYSHRDPDGRLYQLDNLINPNPDRPNLTYEFMGIRRVWRWTKERMQAAADAGLVVQPSPGSVPRYKRYLDEQRGLPLGDVWADIPPINSQAKERLGYPTQKPVALLERIIQLSTSPGDTVLDAFCGCGTTIDAAQGLGRRWIGIDVTHLAINLIRFRLQSAYGEDTKSFYKVVGEPTTIEDATQLAREDPWQFQAWALGLVGARQAGSDRKGGDKGIDGRLYFTEDGRTVGQVVLSVKAGALQPTYVDALVGVVQKTDAQIGALISFNEPTKGMRSIAASAGFYESGTWGKFPRIQLLTVGALMKGTQQLKYPKMRGSNVTFPRAGRRVEKVGEELKLPLTGA